MYSPYMRNAPKSAFLSIPFIFVFLFCLLLRHRKDSINVKKKQVLTIDILDFFDKTS